MTVSRRSVIVFLVIAGGLLGPRDGQARTWYVKADSTGDAPTIRAGIDSAVTGDTVLVAPGTYVFTACRFVEKGIVIKSEAGPTETRIFGAQPPYYFPSCAFYVVLVATGRTEISGFWFDGFDFMHPDGGVIGIQESDSVFVNNNVFTNYNEAGISFTVVPSWWVFIENNTFVGGRYAIDNNAGSRGFVGYNIMWSRARGMGGFHIVNCNCFLDLSDTGFWAPLNFRADPEFCGVVEGQNLFLQSDSPCAPGNIPPIQYQCDSLMVVGALPVGCGTTPVKRASWGSLKKIYE